MKCPTLKNEGMPNITLSSYEMESTVFKFWERHESISSPSAMDKS